MNPSEKHGLVIRSESDKTTDWTDRAVQLAQTCNQIFVKNCAPCVYYAESQVEFESRQEYLGAGPVGRVFAKNVCQNFEVAMYKQFLFDEDSVLEGVQIRDEHDMGSSNDTKAKHSEMDDAATVTTQRTN